MRPHGNYADKFDYIAIPSLYPVDIHVSVMRVLCAATGGLLCYPEYRSQLLAVLLAQRGLLPT